MKKSPQIDGVGQPGERTGRYSDRTDVIRAGLRELAQNGADLENAFRVRFLAILIHRICHGFKCLRVFDLRRFRDIPVYRLNYS